MGIGWLALIAAVLVALPSAAKTEKPVELQLAGDWQVQVSVPDGPTATVEVQRPQIIRIIGEKHEGLPVFNPNAGGWIKGAQLRGVQAQETTTPFLLDPASLILRSAPGADSPTLQRGTDYQADTDWGTFGRLANGGVKAGQAVYVKYAYSPLRLDSIVLTREGKIRVRTGLPKSAAPSPPDLQPGERRLANVWLPGRVRKLGPENLFPLLESVYPEPKKPKPTVADRLVPRALEKLRTGQPIRILAWGDSVTVGTYVPDPAKERWQAQFVSRLQKRFPKSKIELVTEAWGGRNTGSYLAEPPGAEHNYKEKVLAAKPDLIVSEFVNDAGLNPAQVEERYGKLLADFKGIGAEWIILTPHYVRPDWMGLTRERDIDDDPRPYVKGLRLFAEKHGVALADASLRYGRLWRQGIPYSALMLNSINHPDARGMALFADALMELFP